MAWSAPYRHSHESDLSLNSFDGSHDISSDDDGLSTCPPPDHKFLLDVSHHEHLPTRRHNSIAARFCALFIVTLQKYPATSARWLLQGRRKWFLLLLPLLGLIGLVALHTEEKNVKHIDGKSPPWYPTPRGGSVGSWAAAYEKAGKLVSRMTLPEKINITTGTGWMNGLCVGNTGSAPSVGFPSLCLQDGPQGLRFTDNITAGPAGITVGATWNRELTYKRGRMLGIEAKMKGINAILGPSAGPMGRSPLGGRNWEGFGADPVLQAAGTTDSVLGIQAEGVMATVKHLVGNEQEHFRRPDEWSNAEAISSNIDDRTLHEVYAWPFAAAIRVGVASVMCSYQQVNNSYACQNSKLLNGILKDELGFQGFVQSDWLATRSGVASALAGLDMNMPGDGLSWADGDSLWGSRLTQAVLNTSLPLERLNDMTTRIVAAWYKLGQDDTYYWHPPPPFGDGGPNFSSWTDEQIGLIHPGTDDSSTAIVNRFVDAKNVGGYSHSSLARRIAAEGTVLLKNDQDFLPLNRTGHSQATAGVKEMKMSVGVFGMDAIGNPAGPNSCKDRACNTATLATGWGSGTAEFPYLVSPVEALRGTFHPESVDLSIWPTNDLPPNDHQDVLGLHDLCIVFVNADSGEGAVLVNDVQGDRNDFLLDNNGERLAQYVAANCGRDRNHVTASAGDTVVVVHSVGPVSLEGLVDIPSIRAILWANLPGQESGNALTDVLFGDVNPSGHLPYTIGKTLEDYGPAARVITDSKGSVPQQDFNEGVFIDYRWFDRHSIEPRFEFGYGLSYTTFHIDNLVIESMLHAEVGRPLPMAGPRPLPENQPPSYSQERPDPASALFPVNWPRLKKFVYPYIESVEDIREEEYPYPLNDGKEAISPAGGGEGGHPELWDVLVRVSIDVSNMHLRSGQAVPQLYVAFPKDVHEEHTVKGTNEVIREPIDFPPRQLRAFAKVHLAGGNERGQARGEARRLTLELTRRDLSYWSVRQQNWIIPDGTFGIEVGFSSRDIRVRGEIF